MVEKPIHSYVQYFQIQLIPFNDKSNSGSHLAKNTKKGPPGSDLFDPESCFL